MGDYYRYEKTFEDDAALSSTSLLSDRSRAREYNTQEEKEERTQKRLQAMLIYDCAICTYPLSQEPLNLAPEQIPSN